MHAVTRRPRGRSGALLGLAAGLVGLVVLGCETADPGSACGEGTMFLDGRCVADITPYVCGPGTHLEGSDCVLDPSVGADTASEGDVDSPTDDVATDDTAAPTDDTVPSDDTASTICPESCPDGQLCFEGECRVPDAPPDYWSCFDNLYNDGFECDCECGFPDPDCSNPELPVHGCEGGAACQPSGLCGECVPVCDGLACGDDGCGGSCGDCTGAGEICVEGQCKLCSANCDGRECGDDGCGGSCGACDGVLACSGGLCLPPAANATCEGHCGGVTESGCWCTPDCETYGDCCADIEVCACSAGCGAHECGDDGCGGSCGTCGAGYICELGKCEVKPPCSETGCNDHGTCDSASGDCSCSPGFAGPLCDECAPGRVGYPLCGLACSADVQCADGDDCTEDTCTADFGCLSVHAPLLCDDGNPCTSLDVCGDQGCHGLDDGCDDGNACTTDACGPSGCLHSASGATSCDDGDPCTAIDTCAGTTCHGTGEVDCDDGSMCTVDACAPGEGCIHDPVPDEAPCALPDNCVFEAACRSGACVATRRRSCFDFDPCTADVCLPATGACENPPIVDGGACEDSDPCTTGETCSAGLCVPDDTVCLLPAATPVMHFSAFPYGSLSVDETTGEVYTWFDMNVGGFAEPEPGGELPTWEPTAVLGRPGVRFAKGAALRVPLAGNGATPTSLFAVVCLEPSSSPVMSAIATVGADGLAPVWSAKIGDGLEASAGGEDGWLYTETRGCMVVLVAFTASGVELVRVSGDTTESDVVDTVLPPSLGGSDVLRLGGSTRPIVLGELLIYEGALDAAARADVISTLRRAWGFPAPKPDAAYDPDDASRITLVDPPPFPNVSLVETLASEDTLVPLTCVPASPVCPFLVPPDGYSTRAGVGFYPTPNVLPLEASPGTLVDSALTVVAATRLDAPSPDGVLFQLGAGDVALSLTQHTCSGCAGEVRFGDAGADGGALLDWPIGTVEWHVVTATTAGTGECTVRLDDGATDSTPCATLPADQDSTLSVGSLVLPSSDPAAPVTLPMGGLMGEFRLFTRALHPLDRAYVERLMAWKYSLW